MRAQTIGNAPPLPPRDIPAQFAEVAAAYEGMAKSLDPTKPPPIEAVIMMTFLRVQMVDLKLDMLAIKSGAARDTNAPRIITPGGH